MSEKAFKLLTGQHSEIISKQIVNSVAEGRDEELCRDIARESSSLAFYIWSRDTVLVQTSERSEDRLVAKPDTDVAKEVHPHWNANLETAAE